MNLQLLIDLYCLHYSAYEIISLCLRFHTKYSCAMLQFLNLLQSEVRELKRNGQSSHTTTVMLIGIPNSGKSALANSLHQIGRISAEGMKSLNFAVKMS